jgi:hypothetical protein
LSRFAAALAVLLTLVIAAPAVAEPAEPSGPEGVDLAVTVTFEKPAYFAYERIATQVAVVNNGTAPATGVTLTHEENAPFAIPTWGGLDPAGPGTTVQPGERIDLPATVELFNVVDVVRMAVEVHTTSTETDTTNNTANAEATITVRTTDLTARLYGDRDGDRQFDPDEALVGVLVEGEGGTPRTDISTRTGVDGRFTVPNVPEGSYFVDLGLPAGWQQDESAMMQVLVGGPELMVRAVRDSSELRGSVTFDRSVYAVGDTIREHVTLTNSGNSDLSGVTARCVEGAAPNQLSGMGWGDLVHYEAPGVTVRAGETRTFDFTDVVPPGGRLYGFISLTCWFSTAFRYDDGPMSVARADVPGGRGSSGGVLYVDRNDNASVDAGEPVPGVKVCLVDNGRVVGRAVSDANGHFLFADLPANSYSLRLVGPWRLRVSVDLRIGVYDGEVMDWAGYAIEPGPNQLDLDAKPVPTVDPVVAPAPKATPAPHPSTLAATGADVAPLAALGALLVVLGFLLMRRGAMS